MTGHRIPAELPVPPGGYVILARNGDKATNGEIAADYEYRGINLTNDGDVIELVEPTGRVVDRVEYGEALVFPGASTSLDPGSLEAGANDDCRQLVPRCHRHAQRGFWDAGTGERRLPVVASPRRSRPAGFPDYPGLVQSSLAATCYFLTGSSRISWRHSASKLLPRPGPRLKWGRTCRPSNRAIPTS